MSGDGVEDIEIPSVFIKKSDAILLQNVLMDHGDVVLEIMAAEDQKKEETLSGDDEKMKTEDMKDESKSELSKDDEAIEENRDHSSEVQELSQKVQSLLEGINVDKLPEELKDTFKNELGKLKELNLEGQAVSSPESTCSGGVSRSDLKRTIVDQLNTLQDLHSTTPLRIPPIEDPNRITAQENLQDGIEVHQVSSDSAEKEVREQSLDQEKESSCTSLTGEGESHHTSTCNAASSQSNSEPGPG